MLLAMLLALAMTTPSVTTGAAGAAETIPDPLLRASLDRCVASCSPAHGVGSCAKLCGCMVGEMAERWDMDDFRARTSLIRTNEDDPRIRLEMDRLAAHCAAARPGDG